MKVWAVTFAQGADCEAWGEDDGFAGCGAFFWVAVAICSDREQVALGHEERSVAPDNRARRQRCDVGFVSDVGCGAGDNAGCVQGCVEGFGAVLVVQCRKEVDVGGASAKRTGAVAGGKSDGFVQKEKFGVIAGAHDGAVPVFVF